MTQLKQCIKCERIKSADHFYKERRVHDGLTARCKECMKADAGQSYETRKADVLQRIKSNYSTKKAKEATLRTSYGMTIEEWTEMLQAQDHLCAICRSPEPRHNGGMLVVDHCHSNLHVRGLLCGSCNAMLGLARDSKEILLSAIDYLEKNKTGEPIPKRRQRLGVAKNTTKSVQFALKEDMAIIDKLVKQGRSWNYIANALNEAGIPTATVHSKWRGCTVKKVAFLRKLHLHST